MQSIALLSCSLPQHPPRVVHSHMNDVLKICVSLTLRNQRNSLLLDTYKLVLLIVKRGGGTKLSNVGNVLTFEETLLKQEGRSYRCAEHLWKALLASRLHSSILK